VILGGDLRPLGERVELVLIQSVEISGLLDEFLAVDVFQKPSRNACHFREQPHECVLILASQQTRPIRSKLRTSLPLKEGKLQRQRSEIAKPEGGAADYDRDLAKAVADLYPGDANTPLTSSQVARKWIKRRKGLLTNSRAELLARWHKEARWEGSERPDWSKAKTLDELLDTRLLAGALEACREACLFESQQLKVAKDIAEDPEHVLQQLKQCCDLIRADTDMLALSDGPAGVSFDSLAGAFAVGALVGAKNLVEAQRAARGQLLSELGTEFHWLIIIQDTLLAFGIPRDEIVQAQGKYRAELDARLRNCLRLLKYN